jgi:hypothetical protein
LPKLSNSCRKANGETTEVLRRSHIPFGRYAPFQGE